MKVIKVKTGVWKITGTKLVFKTKREAMASLSLLTNGVNFSNYSKDAETRIKAEYTPNQILNIEHYVQTGFDLKGQKIDNIFTFAKKINTSVSKIDRFFRIKSGYLVDGGSIECQSQVQTLVFNKSGFKNEKQAKDWAKKHSFKFGKVDNTDKSYRIRQENPKDFTKSSFRTITITDNVKGVIACPIENKEDGGEIQSYEYEFSFRDNEGDLYEETYPSKQVALDRIKEIRNDGGKLVETWIYEKNEFIGRFK